MSRALIKIPLITPDVISTPTPRLGHYQHHSGQHVELLLVVQGGPAYYRHIMAVQGIYVCEASAFADYSQFRFVADKVRGDVLVCSYR